MMEVQDKKPASQKRGVFTPQASAVWKRLRENQVWAGHGELSLTLHLSRISKLLNTELEATADISLPQMRILFEAMSPEGVSQATLHRQYGIDPGSITRTVQGMERDGLVTRKPDPADNRLMLVYITDKGRELAQLLPARLAEAERDMSDGLSDDEVRLFHSMLERLENSLQRRLEEKEAEK